MWKRFSSSIIALLAVGATAGAEPLSLSLDQAIKLALEQNLSLRSSGVLTQVSQAGVAAEAARFGRSLNLSVGQRGNRSPSISSLEQVQTATSTAVDVNFGVTQQLSSGGQVSVLVNNNRASSNAAYRTIDPVYSSDVQLNLRQPLLQGRGKINRAGLELARNQLDAAYLDQQGRQRALEAEVGAAYWELYYARANLETIKLLGAGAQRVLETAKAREEVGAGTQSSVLQAEVGVARRQEEMVVALGTLNDAEDRLRISCGLDQGSWSVELVPTDRPTLTEPDVDLAVGLKRAQTLDTAYGRAELEQKNLDLQIEQAKDRTRPAVDFNATIGLSGIGGSSSSNWETLRQAEGRSWQTGFSVNMPLGQNSDGARLQQRQLEKERAAIDLAERQRQIAQSVHSQHRQVSISHRRSQVAQLAEKLAARNVQEQEERLELGLATVRQVLDAQDDLAASRASHLRAVVDYNKALVQWKRLTGL